jgi:hypothetical protein
MIKDLFVFCINGLKLCFTALLYIFALDHIKTIWWMFY